MQHFCCNGYQGEVCSSLLTSKGCFPKHGTKTRLRKQRGLPEVCRLGSYKSVHGFCFLKSTAYSSSAFTASNGRILRQPCNFFWKRGGNNDKIILQASKHIIKGNNWATNNFSRGIPDKEKD